LAWFGEFGENGAEQRLLLRLAQPLEFDLASFDLYFQVIVYPNSLRSKEVVLVKKALA
jgi:hypothetical protein